MDEKLLDKINALIAKANSTEFPEERESFLAAADRLMMKYKIDEITLAARRSGKAPQSLAAPTHEEMDWVGPWDEFYDIHTAIMAYLSYLTGVQCVRKFDKLHIFGYAADIRYFRELWTSVYLTFSAKLNPKWDRGLSDGENIKMLVESGQKWRNVWYEARAVGALADVACPPKDNGKMKRLYAKACKDSGVEKMKLTHRTAAYRDSFSVGYRDVIWERAVRLKEQRLQMEREASDGVSVVLRRQATAVEDLMNSLYPDLEYGKLNENARKATHANAQAMGATAGRSVDLAGTSGVGGSADAARPALG